LAHFFADVIMYTLVPFIQIQDSETARYLAITGVIVTILMALIWAYRALIVESHRPQMVQ
jgi:hypothetical protein